MASVIYTALSYEQEYSKLYSEAQLGAYTSFIRGKRCQTEDDLFHEISASFQFPWYFGENWAALDECLCDLEWLSFKRIFLIISDFSKMFKGNTNLQKILIKYLECAVEYWESQNVSFEILLNN